MNALGPATRTVNEIHKFKGTLSERNELNSVTPLIKCTKRSHRNLKPGWWYPGRAGLVTEGA